MTQLFFLASRQWRPASYPLHKLHQATSPGKKSEWMVPLCKVVCIFPYGSNEVLSDLKLFSGIKLRSSQYGMKPVGVKHGTVEFNSQTEFLRCFYYLMRSIPVPHAVFSDSGCLQHHGNHGFDHGFI